MVSTRCHWSCGWLQDPITYSLMEDPVELPSGLSVDRTSIMRHLLSNTTDPFSRQPLTVEQLKPNNALRAQIQAWKAEQRRPPS